jgi:hypothetical protein
MTDRSPTHLTFWIRQIPDLVWVPTLKASHPPAAVTTLLFALGGFQPTLHETIVVTIGVLIVAIIGDILRQLRLKAMA